MKNIVSIIIPIYNAEKYIRETMDSILSQNYSDYEILAIDDRGTDGTMKIVEDYAAKDSRIRILRNETNRGIAYSRNRALKEAEGEYIALLDDDDIMCPNRLRLQVEFLNQHPDIGGVGGNAIWIDENGNEIRDTIDVITDPDQVKMFLLLRNIFNNGEMMVRRSIVEEHHLQFGENCYGMEDYYFWIHFSKVAKLTNLKETVLKKRQFSQNETSKMRSEYAESRLRKYHELQFMSLELSGFKLDEDMKKTISLYFGEDHTIPAEYKKIEHIFSLLDELIEQAKKCEPAVVEYMQRWFLDIMEAWHRSSWKWNAKRWGDAKRGEYIDDLINAQNWHVQHEKDMEEWIQELERRLHEQ